MAFSFGNTSTGSFTFGSSSNNNNNNNTTNNNNNSNNNNSTNTNTNANGSTNNNASINTNTNTNSTFNFGNNNNTNTNNNANQSSTNTANNTFNFGNNNNNQTSTNNTNFNFANGSNNNNNNNNNMNNFNSNLNPLMDIQRLYNQYNNKHELCRFQTVLYNKIPSSMNVNLFNNKPPLIRSIIWDQGIKNNPNPNKLVPVGISGYKELNQRSNLCLAGHCSSIKSFKDISEKINILKNEINIKTKQTITDLKQTQIHLSHRLLVILRLYIIKITNTKPNNHFSQMEIKLKNVLQQMCKESKQLMNLYGHINKLSYDLDINLRDKSYNNNNIILNDMHNTDKKNMKQMFSFLKQQQQFLQLLTKTVQNDIKDLNIIANGTQSKTNSPPGAILNSSSMLY